MIVLVLTVLGGAGFAAYHFLGNKATVAVSDYGNTVGNMNNGGLVVENGGVAYMAINMLHNSSSVVSESAYKIDKVQDDNSASDVSNTETERSISGFECLGRLSVLPGGVFLCQNEAGRQRKIDHPAE